MDIKALLFEINEGMLDRMFRLLIGFALVLAFAQWAIPAPLNYGLLLLGIIGIFTGVSGHCMLYAPLGISTAGRKRSAPKPKKKRR